MKIQFNTNILLNDGDKGLWLDELGFESEDCGVFHPIEIDSIDYRRGDMNGRVSINGINYSFDLEDIFEHDHDFNESPLFYWVDYTDILHDWVNLDEKERLKVLDSMGGLDFTRFIDAMPVEEQPKEDDDIYDEYGWMGYNGWM